MTASSILPGSPDQPAAAEPPAPAAIAPGLAAWLGSELVQRLERALAGSGQPLEETCAQWVRTGLEQLEVQQARDAAAGRCSIRTGTCTTGPVPLPVQQ